MGVPACNKGRSIDRLMHFSELPEAEEPNELPLWEAVRIYFDLTGDRGCFSVPALFYIGSVRRCEADR